VAARPAGAPAPVFVFYISGHGFGHAVRDIETMNAIAAACPEARVIVRTAAARWLLDASARASVEYHHLVCDTGIAQLDSLQIDVPGTFAGARAFMAGFDRKVADEAAFLTACGATCVVGDMPPLAFAAAARANVPAVALGNFTWDWIYAGYPESASLAPGLVEAIREAYRCATLTLRLPMWGGFEEWASPIVDLPLVARHARRDPRDVRRLMAVPEDHRLVLASFGGIGIDGLQAAPLGALDGYTVMTTAHGLSLRGPVPPGLLVLEDREVYAKGLRYEDLVCASDVVVTKPGYGIIADCVANGAAMLYTSRGHFVEYDVLVAAMPAMLRCRFLEQDELYAGRWQASLDAVLAQPAPPLRPATNGAALAAELLLGSGTISR
jgi:hypothetical protein